MIGVIIILIRLMNIVLSIVRFFLVDGVVSFMIILVIIVKMIVRYS